MISQLTQQCSDNLDSLLFPSGVWVGEARRTFILFLVVISQTAIYGSPMSITRGSVPDTSCQYAIYDDPNYWHPIC